MLDALNKRGLTVLLFSDCTLIGLCMGLEQIVLMDSDDVADC